MVACQFVILMHSLNALYNPLSTKSLPPPNEVMFLIVLVLLAGRLLCNRRQSPLVLIKGNCDEKDQCATYCCIKKNRI